MKRKTRFILARYLAYIILMLLPIILITKLYPLKYLLFFAAGTYLGMVESAIQIFLKMAQDREL